MPYRKPPTTARLQTVPAIPGKEALCPNCDSMSRTVLGRVGLRLVYECSECSAQHFGHHAVMETDAVPV
jgi:hypothetical protein